MPLPFIAAGLGLGALSERYGVGFNYKDLSTVILGNDGDMEERAFGRAKAILITEEGRRKDVYLDTRGILTVGIGHKVLAADNLKLGDKISDAQIDDFFSKDINKAFSAAIKQSKEINRYNVDMIARLTSVNFQLGTGWTAKFPNTWALLRQGNGAKAAQNILVSDWAQQTPNRANRFAIEIQTQFA